VKRLPWAIVGCLVAVPLLVTLVGFGLLRVVSLGGEFPGGMSPTYAAVDYDPRLTREAATAKPVIAALNRYQRNHSTYPVEASELAPYLPPASVTPTALKNGYVCGWKYLRSRNDKGYVLSLRLGWDPSLGYWYDGSKGHWIFEPGDGSAEKQLILNP
jgi:hypothetical protein